MWLLILGPNLALNKPAMQSSENAADPGPAWLAVDGNKEDDYNASPRSCSQTDAQLNANWAVDLEQNYVIEYVVITNRGDCCGKYFPQFCQS